MAWTTTSDPDAYLAAAGAFLRAEPARNSVLLTVVEAMRAGGRTQSGALLGWWQATGAPVDGAVVHTPPYPVSLTAMPEAAAVALADVVAAAPARPAAVTGDARATETFAAAWTQRAHVGTRVMRRMRLHRLGTLALPEPAPPGAPVVAAREHRGVVLDWYRAFGVEIGEPDADVEPAVDDRLAYGGITLWLRDGRPVALAGITRTVAGTARVAPVYTPPEERGRGYGAAATAEVTRAALAGGAGEVVLYTDLDNPTSNRLYARLGYEPVEDRVVLAFDG